jgi:hypothetical protein
MARKPAKPAPKKAKPKAAPEKRATGRPLQYRPEFAALARRACAMFGATDQQLADLLGFSERSVRMWREKYPEFAEACASGKAIADEQVERRLYERAVGYEVDTVKILQHQGAPVIIPYREKYAPDTVACIFWLKNRKSAQWRDRVDLEHNVGPGLAELLSKRRERARSARGK